MGFGAFLCCTLAFSLIYYPVLLDPDHSVWDLAAKDMTLGFIGGIVSWALVVKCWGRTTFSQQERGGETAVRKQRRWVRHLMGFGAFLCCTLAFSILYYPVLLNPETLVWTDAGFDMTLGFIGGIASWLAVLTGGGRPRI